jgi:hypothetical protein
MIKFKSKTELAEHIHELVKAGYLHPTTLTIPEENGHMTIEKVYSVNFDNINVMRHEY